MVLRAGCKELVTNLRANDPEAKPADYRHWPVRLTRHANTLVPGHMVPVKASELCLLNACFAFAPFRFFETDFCSQAVIFN